MWRQKNERISQMRRDCSKRLSANNGYTSMSLLIYLTCQPSIGTSRTGVNPLISRAKASTFKPRSQWTNSRRPHEVASCNGVLPFLGWALTPPPAWCNAFAKLHSEQAPSLHCRGRKRRCPSQGATGRSRDGYPILPDAVECSCSWIEPWCHHRRDATLSWFPNNPWMQHSEQASNLHNLKIHFRGEHERWEASTKASWGLSPIYIYHEPWHAG